jgi:hypothetical protein
MGSAAELAEGGAEAHDAVGFPGIREFSVSTAWRRMPRGGGNLALTGSGGARDTYGGETQVSAQSLTTTCPPMTR